MPLRGIGTGNFMYNICGSFGPFQMKPDIYEEHFLKQAAFHNAYVKYYQQTIRKKTDEK